MQASSSTITNDSFNPPPKQHPWDKVGRLPEKAALWEYGYVMNGQPVSSTREHLIRMIEARGTEIQFVWTPEFPEPVLPERVPFLLEGFRRRHVTGARTNMLLSGILFVAVIAALALDHSDGKLPIWFVVALSAVVLVKSLWTYRRSGDYTQADAISDASTERFRSWLKKQALSGYTITIIACITVVGLVQAIGDGQSAAGLVKASVRAGEIWRLFTATLMQANISYFVVNVLALMYFSRLIDQTLHRAYVPLVFLVAGVLGSISSVVIAPNTNSQDASAGLIGLLGFIAIAAYFDRRKYPPKYLRYLIRIIVVVGVIGFAVDFIDNAAHLGGLVGGLAFGWFPLRGKMNDKPLLIAGTISSIVLVLSAAMAIYKLIS